MALYDTPLAGNKIKNTQNPIRQNFLMLATMTNPTEGVITFPKQTTSPTVAANNVGLYSLLNGTTGLNELYFKRNGDTSVVGVPLTAGVKDQGSTSVSGSYTSLASRGWYYLPTGAIAKYGLANYNPATSNLFYIDLDTIGIPYASQLYSVSACYSNLNGVPSVNAINYVSDLSNERTLVFDAAGGSAGRKIWFYVIGV